MGKYTVISDVGKAIVNMLRDQMIPEPVSKPENIGLCDPKERGSFIVGIHAYDIKESDGLQQQSMVNLPNGYRQNAPTFYDMNYMISVVSKSEPENRASDEQKIFGRILQIMSDNKVIPRKYMSDALKMSGDEITIKMIPLKLEEKAKIWTMFNDSYRLSSFYVLSPIKIESAIITKVNKRVTSVKSDMIKK